MQDLAERLVVIEGRLNRCLADGWRNSESDRQALAGDAEEIASLGLSQFAERLRTIVSSDNARVALDEITLARASLHLLRARLGGSTFEANGGPPWVVPRKGRAADRESLWPLGRFSLGDMIVWSCLRSRGYPVEWVLVEERDGSGADVPWFGPTLTGHLHWRGRFPVGTRREVQVVALQPSNPSPSVSTGPDVYQAIRKRFIPGKVRDDKLPAWGGGSIRLTMLEPDELDGCWWCDPMMREQFLPLLAEQCWTFVWEPGDVRVPIGAVVEQGRIFKKLHVVHLVPGCPMTELGNLT